MDLDLADIVELAWSRELMVTRAEGPCSRVLGRSLNEVLGHPLHVALEISRVDAEELDRVGRTLSRAVRFLSIRRGKDVSVLRFNLAARDGLVVSAVMDLGHVLAGAPPLQLAKLSSSLSHEIRNPLSSVKMAVQTVARSAGLSERDQRRLAIANREVRTMERMLLLFSEYGRETPPNRENVHLRSVLQEAVALVAAELAERKIQVHIEEPEGVSARVAVDGARLRPVLAQLVLNVAMGQTEGSTVTLSIRRTTAAVEVVLNDPNAVLDPDERPTLFEPFGSMLARGAGLSLAALQRVMQGHGGQVRAEAVGSNPGTMYILTFPV